MIWIVLAAIFMPYTIAVFVGDLKFTPGKLVVVLLFLPALTTFFLQVAKRRSRLMASDYFAFASALWLVTIPIVSPAVAFVPAVSLTLEFLGPYLIARAYFSNELALQEFEKALKVILIVVIALGLLDTLSGRFVTNEVTASIFGVPDARSVRGDAHFRRELFGFTFIRATSTLDHPILYGTFCATVGAILLYAERGAGRQILYLALCTAGCLLSVSSAPLLGLMIAASVLVYDALLARQSWRWKALLTALVVALVAVFAVSNNPVGWLIGHLTLDQQTGYFRLLIWDRAFAVIGSSPWIGDVAAVNEDDILSSSTDSVWLVEAMTFGLPLVVLHLLANFCAFGFSRASTIGSGSPRMDHLATGLTLSLVLFVFIGLTVHFWNALWLFWALCIGIRTSLKDNELRTCPEFRAPVATYGPGIDDFRNRQIGPVFR